MFAYRTTTKQYRMDEYLSAESLPDLTSEELLEIKSAYEGVHQRYFIVSDI